MVIIPSRWYPSAPPLPILTTTMRCLFQTAMKFRRVNVPELDEAYKASRSTTDSEKRLAEIRRVVEVMGDKAVIVPICENTKAVAANKDLKGLRADAEGIYRIAEWSWE